jgi:hypothetical protein
VSTVGHSLVLALAVATTWVRAGERGCRALCRVTPTLTQGEQCVELQEEENCVGVTVAGLVVHPETNAITEPRWAGSEGRLCIFPARQEGVPEFVSSTGLPAS